MGIYVYDFCYRKQMFFFFWVVKLIEWKIGVVGSYFILERVSLFVNKVSKRKVGLRDREIFCYII